MPARTRGARRGLAAALLLAPLGWGCAAPPPAAPLRDPPPARPEALAREDVVQVARGQPEPDDAIRRLDAHPFSFELDGPALDWFAGQGLAPAVLDYLHKRSRVDWRSLRGDVDPEAPR